MRVLNLLRGVMNYRLIVLAILLCMGAGCGGSLEKKQPFAYRGIIDLHNWDFEKDGTVELNGEWEFFWEQFLDTNSVKKRNAVDRSHYIWVPGIWNNQFIDGKKLSGHGYGTYRLRVLLKKRTKTDVGDTMALLVHDMGTAYSLFINGEKKAQGGYVASSHGRSIPGYWPDVVDFISVENEVNIILHLSNFHHRKGGVWEKVILGNKRSVHNMRGKRLVLDFFLIGSIFMIACYHLVLFTMRKKDMSYLYFGLICIIIPVRILVTGEFYLVRIFPNLQWKFVHMLEYLTVYTSIPLFFMFLRSLFPSEFNVKVLRVYQIIGIIFSCIVIVTQSQIYTHIMPFFHVVSFLICVYGLYALILALTRKCDGAVPFMIGFAALFLSVSNDFLYNNRIILTGYAVPYGLFFFILSQAFILSRRFTRTFSDAENMSKELEGKNTRLLNLDKLKDEFLAAVSHELRTPLHGIIGMTQSMIEIPDKSMSDESRHNLGLIAVSGKRLANLIDDISDFARLKNRDIILCQNPVDIKMIADIVIVLSRPLAGNKNIDISNDISSLEPPVYADENRVHQILHNLVGNAVKFTNEGCVTVSAEVNCDDAGAGWMKISVSDTGIGIPADRQEIIFEGYRQADAAIQRQYGGAGIGLSIVRQLVELHGGALEVRSIVGKGSVFSFTLPLYRSLAHEIRQVRDTPIFFMQDHRGHAVPQEIKAHDYTLSGSGGRLLIVDDDIINLHVIKSFLSSEDYSVVAETDGMDAMELIKQQTFDLILLDIMMPKVSGYEICAELRKRFSLYELPVIFLTARSGIEDLVMAFDLGANDYLTKPIHRDELLARVRTLVTLKITVQAHNEARFKLLQGRMSPHFLFNALNTVHALIHKNKATADAAVIKLADNYRFLIEHSSRSLISFDAEWQFVMNYLDLEELRYSDTLTVRMKKEGDFSEVLIPPLTIQPIVENSLKHGIWKQSGKGAIRVSAAVEGGRVRIIVQDNGAGLQSGDIYSRSLGNIRKRLTHYFEDIEFSVRNIEAGGVEVIISYCYKKTSIIAEIS